MSYSYASTNRLTLPEFLPGVYPYANDNGSFDKEYANAAGGTKATATITTTLAVGSVPGDTITYLITPVGMAPFSVVYTVPDPKPTGAALQTSILEAITADPRIKGLGTWTSDADSVDFTSLEVGQRLDIAVAITAAVGTATVARTQGLGFGVRIAPGRAVVTDTSVAHAVAKTISDRLEIAFLPTQDIADAGSTQKWVGVNKHVEDENLEASGFPAFSNDYSTGVAYQQQLAVRRRGHITVELETPALSQAALGPLLYRFAADGAKDQLGIFSFTAGTGLAEVPVGYTVQKITNGGTIALIDLETA